MKRRPKRYDKVCARQGCGKHFKSYSIFAKYHDAKCKSLAAWARLSKRTKRIYVPLDKG